MENFDLYKNTKGVFSPLRKEFVLELLNFAENHKIGEIYKEKYKLLYISYTEREADEIFFDISSVYFKKINANELIRISTHWSGDVYGGTRYIGNSWWELDLPDNRFDFGVKFVQKSGFSDFFWGGDIKIKDLKKR